MTSAWYGSQYAVRQRQIHELHKLQLVRATSVDTAEAVAGLSGFTVSLLVSNRAIDSFQQITRSPSSSSLSSSGRSRVWAGLCQRAACGQSSETDTSDELSDVINAPGDEVIGLSFHSSRQLDVTERPGQCAGGQLHNVTHHLSLSQPHQQQQQQKRKQRTVQGLYLLHRACNGNKKETRRLEPLLLTLDSALTSRALLATSRGDQQVRQSDVLMHRDVSEKSRRHVVDGVDQPSELPEMDAGNEGLSSGGSSDEAVKENCRPKSSLDDTRPSVSGNGLRRPALPTVNSQSKLCKRPPSRGGTTRELASTASNSVNVNVKNRQKWQPLQQQFGSYVDPMFDAPSEFQQRILELTSLQLETMRAERLQRRPKKKL